MFEFIARDKLDLHRLLATGHTPLCRKYAITSKAMLLRARYRAVARRIWRERLRTRRARGKLVAFLEETSYLERRWSCPLTEIERLTALPGDHAWLTVIDDLGQRGKASEAMADAWYAVINRRWLKRGWTIFTSNRFPEELVDQGTINEATFSRLMQLIGMRMVFFNGEVRRLR